jgi:hypothetical protein
LELPQHVLAILSILGDIWSIPVAFLILILIICFSTNSSETDLKNNSLLQSFVQCGPTHHNGAKKKLQLKHKNSLFPLQ